MTDDEWELAVYCAGNGDRPESGTSIEAWAKLRAERKAMQGGDHAPLAKIASLPCELCKQGAELDSTVLCDPCWVALCNRNARQVELIAGLQAEWNRMVLAIHTDPASWPTTPPTEPGWYWMQREGYAPEIAQVITVGRDFCAYVMATRDGDPWYADDLEGARWRPGRVEP